jgi:site-specific DNA recombinase
MIAENRDLEPADIARRNKVSLSYLMRLLRLNYLAPDIITSILDGAQPRELTRRTLIDANVPLDWALQRKIFGFPEQPPVRATEHIESGLAM